MKIQAIGPRPIAPDFFVEDTGALPGTRPVRPHPQVLSPVGALSPLAPRRRQGTPDSIAPRMALEDVRKSFHAQRKEPEKESESGPVTSGRPLVGSGAPRPPTRTQRRRLAAHHHEPDHHDTPHPQLNSGSAEALFAARLISTGPAEQVSGLGQQAQPRQVPVDQAGDSDQTRFDRPRDRRNHTLAALQRLLNAPLQDPLKTHPERYDAAAKAALKQRMQDQGASFRTSPAEHEEFREAFLFQTQANLPARLKAAGATLAHQAYDALMGQVEQLQRSRPELRHIPAEDLAALRAFTDGHRDLVQDALHGDQVPANPLGLSFAKAVASALHALPPAYTHQGPAFTRLDAGVGLPFKPGEVHTEWQILGASQAREAGHPAIQTQSLSARNIAAIAARPQDQELVFPPGTGFRTERVTTGPELTVQQSELPHSPMPHTPMPRTPMPAVAALMAARRAAAPAA